MLIPKDVIEDLDALRRQCPMVHNITNYVAMGITANALLAIGASPVMAHAPQEAADMAMLSSALVINIGTLSQEWAEGMLSAGRAAKQRGIPVVMDPAGAGATPYRSSACAMLLREIRPDIIRCNASEVAALCDVRIKSRGVDTSMKSGDAAALAMQLAQKTKAVVSMSGEVDYITDGHQVIKIHNGSPLMPKVTALGCTATAITGAMAAVQESRLRAAASAMAVMGVAGELAAAISKGPGSLQPNFLDTLYCIGAEQLNSALIISHTSINE